MLVELDTYLVPEWALPAIINGDTSGLSDEDEQLITQWEMRLGATGPLVYDIADEESQFTSRPAFGLACNCYNVRVYHYVMSNSMSER